MELYQLFKKHPIITTDSRNCPVGSIFFALKGEKFNANAFAKGALDAGCSYAVVDEKEYAIDERFVLVDNVLESLQELANVHRKDLKTKIIGITGTNGKTTTKELIASVLKEKFNILFTQGNLNNHIGVPLTLLKLTSDHELAIIEMGANHPGEIEFLCNIAEPDYGIITNVGKAHLEGFGSFEGVKKTKAELYGFISKNGKGVFLNKGNEFLCEMAEKNNFGQIDSKFCYAVDGIRTDCKVTGKISECSPYLSVECQIEAKTCFEIKTQLIGSYNTENVLAAVTIGSFFGLSESQIKSGLEKYIPQNNRSQLTVTEKNQLVIDAYNANPTSMKAAVENFSIVGADNKLLILGDMLELGDQSKFEHQAIVELLQSHNLKNVILVGPEFMSVKSSFKCFRNVIEAKEYLIQHPVLNNFILIKGSRGIKLEQIIEIL
jgi:UDP-N-acetylmuramoyl-tripeptide--D-alanyl-D-alanine ligase